MSLADLRLRERGLIDDGTEIARLCEHNRGPGETLYEVARRLLVLWADQYADPGERLRLGGTVGARAVALSRLRSEYGLRPRADRRSA